VEISIISYNAEICRRFYCGNVLSQFVSAVVSARHYYRFWFEVRIQRTTV